MQLSGNKVRKLEFLMAEAVAQGADCVVTIGGIQSNHCRATAVAAKYLHLDCFLILRTSKVQHSTLNNHRFLFIIIIFFFLYHDKIAGPCGQRSWIDWQSPGWAFSRSSCWPYFKRRICKTRECGLFCSVPMHFILLPCVSYFAVTTFYISTSKTSFFMSYYTLLPCIFQCLLDVFWTIPKVKSSQVQSYLNSYLQVSFQDLWISPVFYNIFTKAISSKDPFHWPCWPIEQDLGQKYIDK